MTCFALNVVTADVLWSHWSRCRSRESEYYDEETETTRAMSTVSLSETQMFMSLDVVSQSALEHPADD
jgi:hypothetical protein